MDEPDVDRVIAAWDSFFRARLEKRPLWDGYLRYVDRLARCDLPIIFEADHLAALVGIDLRILFAHAAAPQSFYRTYDIPKRRGGSRSITVPSPSLMAVQRWILEHILNKVPLSENAHGFAKERSVISNAKVHLGSQALLKMDLADFFPSIKLRRVIATFIRAGYPPNVSFLLANLCCLEGSLPQGAPTSPALSNIIAKRLDRRLQGLADRHKLKYTRYADDICFSGDEIDDEIFLSVPSIISSEGFSVNYAKTRIAKMGQKMIVCGVSISNGKLALPRATVRQIKLASHFILKNGLIGHAERTGNWDPILIERLLGKIGFWLQLDPENPTALELRRRLASYDPVPEFEQAVS